MAVILDYWVIRVYAYCRSIHYICQVHSLAHFHWIHRNSRGLATNVACTVFTIIRQRVNDLWYSLSISSNLFMKLISTFVMDSNLLMTKFDFILSLLGL